MVDAVRREKISGEWNRVLAAMLAALVTAALVVALIADPASSKPSPKISVSPQDAEPGETVSTNGSGFPARANGTVTFDGDTVGTFTASKKGAFSARWEVPDGAETGEVVAKTSRREASTELRVESPPPPAPQCSDGRDNDSDGKTDHPADPGCGAHDDDSENPDPPLTPQCSDSRDNDSDGKTDHGNDPGCASHTDNSESPDPSPPPPAGEAQRWSDPATWDGEGVPAAGDEVTIPQDKTVLLDRNTAPLGGLTVNGALVFEDDRNELTSDWIAVHGKLQVGTEADPIETGARITLTGVDQSENVMNMGTKFIGVMGGTLEVHGEDRRSWTRLNATAQKGSRTITLEENPGWRTNDRIAIASTDYYEEEAEQYEEATITAVSGNTLTLSRALSYEHYGQKQTFDGRTVDERAEVALLSRNVKIAGEENSSAEGFGGQIMAMNGGTAKIEGAELTRMGQEGILRRYPVHFHMLGDAGANSYLKNSSLHHTFNRCVTIHGTNNLDVSGNACYDHVGHGYFMEDGAEHDNVIAGNLGMVTRAPEDEDRLLESDRSPATFWITNPDNIVRDNAAAGSADTGFWLAFPEHPTGLFKTLYPTETAQIWPRRTPLGEFSGNTAHSNWTGLNVDDGPNGDADGSTEGTWYNPRTNPTPPTGDQDDSAAVVANFQDFTGYKNRGRAVWLRGENHRLVNATLADNAIGATFASEESMLTGSLVVGETANKGNPDPWYVQQGQVGLDGRSLPRPWEKDFPIRGYEFYDGRVGAENTTFVNFTANSQREASGLGVLLEDRFSLHPRNFASSLRFVNAKRLYMPNPVEDGDRSAVFVDQTGSVTGTAGAVVTANNEFLTPANCTRNGDWNAYVCPPSTEHVSLLSRALDGGPAKIKPLTITREADSKTQTLNGCCDDSTEAFTNLLPARNYGIAFTGGTPTKMRFVLYQGGEENVRWLRLSIPYAQTPKVTRHGCDIASTTAWCKGGKATSLSNLDAMTRSGYYYDANAGRLYLKLYSDRTDWEPLEVAPAQ